MEGHPPAARQGGRAVHAVHAALHAGSLCCPSPCLRAGRLSQFPGSASPTSVLPFAHMPLPLGFRLPTAAACLLQVLAAFLKAIGFIIPLMDAMYANYYTREVMVILIRCALSWRR